MAKDSVETVVTDFDITALNDALEQVEAEGNYSDTRAHYPKNGETTFIPLVAPGSEANLFEPVQTTVQDKVTGKVKISKRFMVWGILVELPKGSTVQEGWDTKVTPVVLPKTAFTSLGANLKGLTKMGKTVGHLDADGKLSANAVAVCITRTGKGFDTKYNVIPDLTVDKTGETYEPLEETLNAIATDFTKWQLTRFDPANGVETTDTSDSDDLSASF